MSRVPLWLQLLVVALGTARLTALVTGDRIARRPRWWVIDTSRAVGEGEGYAAYLVSCPWCAGFWLSLATTCAWLLWPIATSYVLLPWAVAFVAGALVAKLGPTDDPPESRPTPPRPDVY